MEDQAFLLSLDRAMPANKGKASTCHTLGRKIMKEGRRVVIIAVLAERGGDVCSLVPFR
jgi:hypothetical protein